MILLFDTIKMLLQMAKQTYEQELIAMAPQGLTEHALSGAWRLLIARHGEKVRTRIFHLGEPLETIEALRRNMHSWLASERAREAHKARKASQA